MTAAEGCEKIRSILDTLEGPEEKLRMVRAVLDEVEDAGDVTGGGQ